MNDLELMRNIKKARETINKKRGSLKAIEITPEIDKKIHKQMKEDMKTKGCTSYCGACAKVLEGLNNG